MKYVSVVKLKELLGIRIFPDSSDGFSVLMNGTQKDGLEAASILDGWSTKEEAMICAAGIAKMFRLPKERIVLDVPVLEKPGSGCRRVV